MDERAPPAQTSYPFLSIQAGLGNTFKLFRTIIKMSKDDFLCFINMNDFTDKFSNDYSFLRFVKANRDGGKFNLA